VSEYSPLAPAVYINLGWATEKTLPPIVGHVVSYAVHVITKKAGDQVFPELLAT
jgi:hypothetical protein